MTISGCGSFDGILSLSLTRSFQMCRITQKITEKDKNAQIKIEKYVH